MRLLNRIKISTKVFSGFTILLLLLLIISAVSLTSLISADKSFKQYRSLARQTNADGRIQANMLMTRLYAQRFLIQNDDASYKRVWKEFVQMEENLDKLITTLNDPKRVELAERVRNDRRLYSRAFEDVHNVITNRNNIIRNQLDKIGPQVADDVEQLKLAIKGLQDDLGPKAEAEIDNAVAVTLTAGS